MRSVDRVLCVVAVMGGAGFGLGFATPRWAASPGPAPPAAVASAPASVSATHNVPNQPSAPPQPPLTEFIGVLVAGYAVEIQPKAEGKVESVFFHVGDRVAAGTPLANVDVEKTRRDLDMVNAELQAEEAGCRNAEIQLQRRIPLGGRAISREEVDSARAQARIACSKREAQEAKVRQLTQALADAELRAPFDGVVTARYVDPGAVVGPGKPVLRLLGDGHPHVRFGVPDDAVAQVSVGCAVRVTLASLGRVATGVVTRVAPEEDSSSHMVFAVADVDPPGGARWSSGIVVRVSVAPGLPPVRSTPLVPREEGPGGPGVDALAGDAAGQLDPAAALEPPDRERRALLTPVDPL